MICKKLFRFVVYSVLLPYHTYYRFIKSKSNGIKLFWLFWFNSLWQTLSSRRPSVDTFSSILVTKWRFFLISLIMVQDLFLVTWFYKEYLHLRWFWFVVVRDHSELWYNLLNFLDQVLPVIIFFSFTVSILYYYGVMQLVVMKLGWFLQISIGTTACESLSAAGNIFLGMVRSDCCSVFINTSNTDEHCVSTDRESTSCQTIFINSNKVRTFCHYDWRIFDHRWICPCSIH